MAVTGACMVFCRLPLAEETAFRNSSLQAAYLIFACRARGLDTGPMSGFDREKVDAAFFADNGWKSNLLVNIGYGDPGKLYGRLPAGIRSLRWS